MAASFAVAIMAGFSGLSLIRGASSMTVVQRKAMVVMAAIVLGGGIWSMHFVAMLGLTLPIYFFYDALITLVSALVAILVVGCALLILHFQTRTPVTITAAGTLVGLGIVAMHYIGMAGMELCRPGYSPGGVAVAVIASVGFSNLAVWVAYGRRTHRHILLGTVCFGISVFAVHFIAMWQTSFFQIDQASVVGPALSNQVLALGVSLSAFVISGAFLLTGVTFIQPGPQDTEPRDTAPPDAAPRPEDLSQPPAQATSPAESEPAPETPVPVPFEKNGRTHFADRGSIAAVRAEGHYTLLYIGADKLFCPWSISEAQERLGPDRFIRAHRSYLINPAYVTGFERAKDTGVCYFDDVASLPKVPVSRSRLGDVRSLLGL